MVIHLVWNSFQVFSISTGMPSWVLVSVLGASLTMQGGKLAWPPQSCPALLAGT